MERDWVFHTLRLHDVMWYVAYVLSFFFVHVSFQKSEQI